MVLRSLNLISVIKQFNISHIFLLVRPYSITMKNLLPNIYLLNNKPDLKAHLNETLRHSNSKSLSNSKSTGTI